MLAAKERHESRANRITPLPLFIHSSQAQRLVFAPVLFDLGGDAARPHPSAGGMGEVRKGMANFVRRTSDRAREQVAKPLL